MSRQRKISEEGKALIEDILLGYKPTTAGETQNMLKELLEDTFRNY